jgi:hypothetical protein
MADTVFTSDSFTGPAGTAVTAHVGETGATWTRGSSYGAATPPVIDGTGGRAMGAVAANCYIFASAVSAADGEYADAAFDVVTNIDSFGVAARASAATAYIAHFGGGICRIFRLNGSVLTQLTLTNGQQSAAKVLTVGSHTARIAVTGTGATAHIAVTYDGVDLCSADDTSAGRLIAPGSVGLLFNSNSTDTTGIHVTSITGATAAAQAGSAITIVAPATGRIFQRAGVVGTVAVSLSFTGTPASIEARLVQDGTSTAVTGFDWQTKVASPSGASAAFSFANVPQGGLYELQVRDSAAPGAVVTVGKLGVGALIAVIGQSPAMKWFTIGDSTLTPDPKLRMYGNIGAWITGAAATMNGAIAFGNAMVAALGVPVGLLDYGVDGSGLTVYLNGASWLPVSGIPASGNAYTAFKTAVTALGGKIESAVWAQGESDAKQLVTQSDYYGGLGTLFAQLRTDVSAPSLPVVLVTLGRRLDGLVADANSEAIKLAQAQKCADANIYRVDRLDLPVSSDNIHQTPTGFTSLGTRCANAMKAALGLIAQYRGPSIASAVKVSSVDFDLTLTHASGSDFTPTTGITGFSATDPGASNAVIAVSAAVRAAANRIRLTLASAPVGLPNFSYLFGSAPTITSAVKDNSALALPLEYPTSPIGASAAGVTSVNADFAFGYSVRASVNADFAFGYSILAATAAFYPSAARTIKVQAASLAFTLAGGFWNLTNPKQPYGLKDPDSTIDISLDWSDWLADIQDAPAAFSWTVDNGAVKVADSADGALSTLFIKAGTRGAKVAATCHIVTASTPPREEERTVYLQIEDR